MGTVAEGAAADCSNRFCLKVKVLRLAGSGEVVATGFCCNTDITVKSVSSSCLMRQCHYDMEIMGYGGTKETKVTFDAGKYARWDDFDTCLGKDDAVGTVAEGAAADCSNRFGLKVKVLRLTGSGEVVATGFCCNTDITVKSVSSSCLAP